ncbi:MAG: flagellin, partial [Clostridium sp.]|uniref:flagellin n=1 Tax=Clostridium sp. TaxID=1506 RepID=UPI0028FE1118
NGGQTISLGIESMNSGSLNLVSGSSKIETGTFVKAAGTSDAKTVADGDYTVKDKKVYDSTGKEVGTIDTAMKVITFTDTKGTGGSPADAKLTFTTAIADGGTFTIKGDTAAAGTQEIKAELKGTAKELAAGNYEISGTKVLKDGKEVGKVDAGNIVIGDKTIVAADLTASGLATAPNTKFTINGADVSSSLNASGSIETINKAIENVSTQRAKLGAVQNRLEHTTANLNNTSENLTAQAMLAQANQQPQGVLQLLR